MFCSNCGKELEDDIKFCPECGSETQIPVQEITIPKEIKHFNWGAFFLTWIWGIFNKSYIALVALPLLFFKSSELYLIIAVSIIDLVLRIWLGCVGNEMAWKNKEWKDVEHFNNVQFRWAILGIIFSFVLVIVGVINGYHNAENAMNEEISNNVSNEKQVTNDISNNTSNKEQVTNDNINPNFSVENNFCYNKYGSRAICGTVVNNSNHSFNYTVIKINLYDKNGNIVGNTGDFISNLEPNATWKFETTSVDENVATYKIIEVEGY